MNKISVVKLLDAYRFFSLYFFFFDKNLIY